MPIIRQIINIGALLSLLASLLGIGGEAPANRPNLQSLLAPDNSVVASLPASPVDETKVPHYFGPNPNWAQSPFTVPDAIVEISAPTEAGGVQAEAVATIGLNGAVTGITVTNPGTGYSSATVSITGSGAGATADAVVTLTGIVTNIQITAGGTGYTAPTITISGGGATTDATATVYGGVAAVTLGAGDYSGFTFPTVDFDFPNDTTNGRIAKAHAVCAEHPTCQSDVPGTIYTVTGVVVDDPGTGYSVAPGVVIRDGTEANPINNRAQDRAIAARVESAKAEKEGTEAMVTADTGPIVFAAMTPASSTLFMDYVTVNTFGAGYTSAPTATINDPTGTGATAQAYIDTGGVTAITVVTPGSGYMTKDGIKKFTDPLPGLCMPGVDCPAYDSNLPTHLQPKFIPAGVPEAKVYNGVEADEYVIALLQYRTSFSSSLKDQATDVPVGTLVRGYVQIDPGCTALGTGASLPGSQCVPLYNEMMDDTFVPLMVNGAPAFGVTSPQWLGPTIISNKNKPVRIVFHNLLPTGAGGDLFMPVDTTLMGSGMAGGWDEYDPNPVPGGDVTDDVRNPACTLATAGTGVTQDGTQIDCFTKNRETLHLHGGNTPWISDGTPHQWITPAGESTAYPQGVSVGNVPDMNVCQAADDGCMTFYYTNQQSARLMFYHDHAYGLTRLGVYAGGAAGYLITDDTDKKLMDPGGALEGLGLGIPLIVQDRTFVPSYEQMYNTYNDDGTIKSYGQDPTWDEARWGGYGSLWYHHVYMTAQNPGDPSGMSAFGRWMYSPWFWPPANAKYGPIANPYYGKDPEGPDNVRGTADDFSTDLAVPCNLDDPATWQYQEDPFCEPPQIPGTPLISAGMEQFNDTPIVNGTAYPTLELEPKAYRFRILNAANDRFFNFQWYVGDPSTASIDSNYKGEPIGPTEVAFDEALLEAAQTDPPGVFVIPDQSDDGGMDPSYSLPGPDWVVIGSEGGFLPAPVVRDGQQETTWVTDPTVFHVGTVDLFSLLLSPAERADVVVDFSQYAGQTLILYNDGPAAFPARIASYDYFTGAPDMRPIGAPPILPGYGPNTRTIMQVKIAAAVSDPADPATGFNVPELQSAFSHKADLSGVFESGQHPIIVGQAAYNSAYGASFVGSGWCNAPQNPSAKCDGFVRISEFGGSTTKFDTLLKDMFSNHKQLSLYIEPKAIQDETSESVFDEFGRMQANLGVESVPAQPILQNVNLHPYTFPATEMVDTSKLPKATELVADSVNPAVSTYEDLEVTPIGVADDGSQIWRFTHNGVDTHPIHYHAFDVQVLNRVAWDNTIMPPDATELGWKDTVRISPLMDTIVAFRAVVPTLPWDIPNSVRLLNPSMQDGVSMNLSSAAEVLGLPPAAVSPQGEPIDVYNHFVNFGAEYVYHCHILSHEEMDMMRPVTLAYPPWAPTNLVVTRPGGNRVLLQWTDNSASETNWVIERTTSLATPWQAVATIPSDPASPDLTDTTGESIGGTISYEDRVTGNTVYAYRVKAINVVGDTWNYADPNINEIESGGFPTITTHSGWSNIASWVATAPPGTPSLTDISTVRQGNNNRVTLTWTDVANETGFRVQRATNDTFTAGVVTSTLNTPDLTTVTIAVPRGTPGVTRYWFRIEAFNNFANSGWSNALSVVTK
jgi:FtsP/CotA-like multicopper oxidase with cupredoxin domain